MRIFLFFALALLLAPRAQGGFSIGTTGAIKQAVGKLEEKVDAQKVAQLLKWTVKVEQCSVSHFPAIGSDGTIYFGTGNTSPSTLYAINPNGTQKWTFVIGGFPNAPPSPTIGANGAIYVGGVNNFYAVNPDGTQKWSIPPIIGDDRNAPDITVGADGTIYVGGGGNCSGSLYAIDPSSGTQKWTFATGARSYTAPVIDANGIIYVGVLNYGGTGGCPDSNGFYAINPNGTKKWAFSMSDAAAADPIIGADGTIYVAGTNIFYAINSNGTEKWSLPSGGGSPVIGTDGTIYGWDSNSLVAIDPKGTIKWKFSDNWRSANILAPAIGTDGTIYLGAPSGRLYAVNSNGTGKWAFGTDHISFMSPTIGADGTIYVGATELVVGGASTGALYAISGKTPLANSAWPKARHDLQNTGWQH